MDTPEIDGSRCVVLVTGMSGTGRSSALAELGRRGHQVVDTGDPGWIVDGPGPLGDLDRILERVGDRANPFGSTREDRAKIASDMAAYEPLLRAGADHEIVTTAPLSDVVAALERLAAAPRRTSAGTDP